MFRSVRCHACQVTFSLDLEALRPYRDGVIQGQRAPRYWVRCPACGQKNVVELANDTDVFLGKPSAR